MSRPRDTLTEGATRIARPPRARDERCVGQHRDADHILEKCRRPLESASGEKYRWRASAASGEGVKHLLHVVVLLELVDKSEHFCGLLFRKLGRHGADVFVLG